jgi:hypothetical protein
VDGSPAGSTEPGPARVRTGTLTLGGPVFPEPGARIFFRVCADRIGEACWRVEVAVLPHPESEPRVKNGPETREVGLDAWTCCWTVDVAVLPTSSPSAPSARTARECAGPYREARAPAGSVLRGDCADSWLDPRRPVPRAALGSLSPLGQP